MLTGAIELFLISLGLTYFMATTGAGLRVRLAAARPGPGRPGNRRQHGRHGRPRGRRAGSRPPVPGPPVPGQSVPGQSVPERPAPRAGLLVYYLIPCLDEAAVIADTVSALAQLGRNVCGTASLGGNGQFTRLQALRGLGHRPWGTDLTEDLELTLYLAVPWTLVLPWSVLFNYNLVRMVGWIAGWERRPVLGTGLLQQVCTALFWYALSCVPIWLAGLHYWRQQRDKGLLRSFLLGHLLLVGNYVTFAACWRALFRLLTGANGGQKTARLTEHAVPAGGTGPAGAHRGAGRLRPRLALAGGAHRMDAPWLTLAATGAHRGGPGGGL